MLTDTCLNTLEPYNDKVKLLTAHKILIASGAGFFLFFGIQRLLAYQSSGDPAALGTAAGGLIAAVGLTAYYRTIGAQR